MLYRQKYEVLKPQIDAINEVWITDYKKKNPKSKTTKYCDITQVGDYGFVVADNVTFGVSYIDVWDSAPSQWHDETQTIKIMQRYDDCLRMIDECPEIGIFRKETNIEAIRDNGNVFIYVSYLRPEHEILFNNYNAIIVWQQ